MGRDRVVCPKCNRLARETMTRYGIRSECCDMWSWNRYPLADKATHDARQLAHAAFDQLWKGEVLSRSRAYRRLSAKLGREAHMKTMTLEELWMVPKWAKEIREEENDR